MCTLSKHDIFNLNIASFEIKYNIIILVNINFVFLLYFIIIYKQCCFGKELNIISITH